MRDCKTIHPLLSLYRENELSPREKGQVESHLKSCVTARREMETFGRLHDVLKGLPEPQVPPDLHDKIMARIRGKVIPLPAHRGFWTKASWTLATAAVMAFLYFNQITDWGDLRKAPSRGDASRDESAPVKIMGKTQETKIPLDAPPPAMARARKKESSTSFSGNLRSDDGEANQNFASALEDKDSVATKPAEPAFGQAEPSATNAKASSFQKSKAPSAGADKTFAPSVAQVAEDRLNEMDSLGKKSEMKESTASAPSPGYSNALKTLRISQEKLAQSWSGDNDISPVEREDILDSAESFGQAWQAFHPGETAPEVDFTKNAVVLLLAGQKPTSGYSIHVVRLEENEDQVDVWYRVDSPKADSSVAQLITHPWTLQIIPKPGKPVVFQKEP